MRKLTHLVFLAGLLLCSSAFAEIKIAVLDTQMALMESDAAKKYETEDDKNFSPRFEKIKALETEALSLQQRLQKDADKMQQSELERLDLEYKQKVREVQTLSKAFNEDRTAAEQAFLQMIRPKLDKAIEEVLKTGDFDMVLDRAAVVDVKPQWDITLRVIERLNQQR